MIIFFSANTVYSQSFPQGWFLLTNLNGDSLYSVNFVNNFTGWTAGKNGRILKTTNGGSNWNVQSTVIKNTLESIMFTSLDTGYCIGIEGTILKTSNSGINWIVQNSGTNNNLNSASFVNNSTGYAVGLHKTILYTSNGGENWDPLIFFDSVNFYSVKFINENTGWITALKFSSFPSENSTVIYKTTNSGLNWFEQFSLFGSINSSFRSIQFTDSLNGWTTQYSNSIDFSYVYKTNNGGNNWSSQPLGVRGHYSIFFSNPRKGWGVGPINRVSFTTNGGDNWMNSPGFFASINYTSVFFTDSLNGWAVSEDGLIIKTTTGGVLTNFSNISSEIPDKFSLSQNYPNPFNPSTIINYELGITNYVKLIVYDVLGNEVTTLVNENKPAGNHQIEFDGSNYPSGVYLYRLEIDGNIMDTKRMVLLK